MCRLRATGVPGEALPLASPGILVWLFKVDKVILQLVYNWRGGKVGREVSGRHGQGHDGVKKLCTCAKLATCFRSVCVCGGIDVTACAIFARALRVHVSVCSSLTYMPVAES